MHPTKIQNNALIAGLLLLCLWTAGCATQYKAYAGKDLPKERVAILTLKASVSYELILLELDGHSIKPVYSRQSISLLPGEHSMQFGLRIGDGASVGAVSQKFSFKAGKRYIATPVITYEHHSVGHDFMTGLLAGVGVSREQKGTWCVKIEEK